MQACTMNGTPIPLWRIQAVAHPADTRWQGRRKWPELVVRTPSAAMARVVASRLEEDPLAPPMGNESPCFRSGFEDEKLYWVSRIGEPEASAVRGCVEADEGVCSIVSGHSSKRS